MAGIDRFEDLEAWKEARKLTREIYRLTALPSFRMDTALREQLQRASVSIMANIAEGFDCSSDREFLQFLGYALRSTAEVQSHLYVALDQEYIGDSSFDICYTLSIAVKKLIGGFIRYLKADQRSKDAGTSRKVRSA